jgi:hypothetical protein
MFVLTLFFTMRVLVPYENFFGWIFSMMVSYPLLCGLGPLHCATILWVSALSGQQLQLVWRNLTTNEYMNMHRYNHFKIFKDASCQEHVGYHNPFDKGHPYLNCLDFWWYQKRSCRFVPCRCPVCAPSQAAKREKQKRLEAELAAKAEDPAL